MFEGISRAGQPTFLNQIFTELCLTEGGATDLHHQHALKHIETGNEHQT